MEPNLKKKKKTLHIVPAVRQLNKCCFTQNFQLLLKISYHNRVAILDQFYSPLAVSKNIYFEKYSSLMEFLCFMIHTMAIHVKTPTLT